MNILWNLFMTLVNVGLIILSFVEITLFVLAAYHHDLQTATYYTVSAILSWVLVSTRPIIVNKKAE
jgi:predicted tellurium resistance membrane protein TerC